MTKRTLNLIEALHKKYPSPENALLIEFRAGTGYDREGRADAIAMNLWPSKGLELVGFEIKTSRQDWLREMKTPNKCTPIKQFCDRWYLLVDNRRIVKYPFFAGDDSELPDDWGLMISNSFDDSISIIREAPKLKPKPIDRLFLASLMRLAAKDFEEIIIDGKKYIKKT